MYTLNMAGKAKLSTKKTLLQLAEHDHVMHITITEYHVDRDLGHLKLPRGLCRMTKRTKTMKVRPGQGYWIGNQPLYKGLFHSKITYPIACRIMHVFRFISL